MRIVRSWPAQGPPPGRSHVVDDIERLPIYAYDYAPLAGLGDDVLLLEWDIAVGGEELQRFAARCEAEPGRVLAAPYRLYPGGSIKDPTRVRPVWSAWRYRLTQQHGGMEEVTEGRPSAHVVGLGMTYLPRALILAYLDEREPGWGFSDIAFSGWHHRRVDREIRLDWSAHPTHLHYDHRRGFIGTEEGD